MATLENTGRIAFGQFEVDLQSGELWKAGFRVRLQDLPFKVLLALLSKPGQVVTRGELQAQVWGPDTNVDIERALAVAINKVREALADSAENPRFVETLAKRGYRFMAPVTVTSPPLPVAPGSQAAASTAIAEHTYPELPPAVPLESAPQLSRKTLHWGRRDTLFSISTLLLLVLLPVLWLRARHSALPPVQVVQLTHNSSIASGPPGIENLLTLVTDGDRILTPMLIAGKVQLAAFDIGTGEVRPITVPGELASPTLADISRDGSRLLLRSHLSSESEQPLWVVPTAGGSAMRVGNVKAQAATWMPDGTNILIASGNELSVVRFDTGTVMPYVKLPGRAFWLRWSPDGKTLRFTLMDPSTHTSSIWELQSGSATARPLLPNRASHAFECCGTWTAEGRTYVFQATDNSSSNLWEVNGDGLTATQTQLTNGPLSYYSPVAARSGRQVFFFGADPPLGLQRYDGEKLGFRPEPSFLTSATRVDYSRDGKWVAWADLSGRLWRARAADGTERIQLTPDYLEVFMAHWSPDGSRLAVMAREPGSPWQLYLVSEEGGKLEKLFKDARNVADPSWSPDGQHLVYGREPDLMGKDDASHILAIYDLQGHKSEPVPQSEGLFSPRWSPDGKWIAALSLDQKRVMLFDMAGKQWKELAATSASDPVWSRDSKAVYIDAFMAPQQPILRIAVPGGETQVIASTANFQSGEPPNYFFGGLTRTMRRWCSHGSA